MPLTEFPVKPNLWWINILSLQTFSKLKFLVFNSILSLTAPVHYHQ